MTDAEPDAKYLGEIARGLDAAFRGASTEPFDPAASRVVVFSDHHKGTGDKADDFRRCEHAYTAALGWYLEEGYRLFVLGDAEELWEERADPVIQRYRAVLELEAQFRARGGLERFWGNHDDEWRHDSAARSHLWPVFGQIKVREALRLEIARADRPTGTLFFVHGHQGTADSDRFGFLSRLFVRWVWRPLQRATGYSATTPASSYELRARHDRAMYAWARSQRPGLVLVAGHTHRPVFAKSLPDPPPTRPVAELETLLADATTDGDAALAARLRAELEYARTSLRRPEPALEVDPPCYFNTGCCSFPDGDITGIEIADGEIRLVRWPANLGELVASGGGIEDSKRILQSEALDAVLDRVAEVPLGEGTVEEHPIAAPER